VISRDAHSRSIQQHAGLNFTGVISLVFFFFGLAFVPFHLYTYGHSNVNVTIMHYGRQISFQVTYARFSSTARWFGIKSTRTIMPAFIGEMTGDLITHNPDEYEWKQNGGYIAHLIY